mgnify:CR=1 FL=1
MKVLIISHNPFSTYQSMGKTFLSLFSKFDKEELCQLYIYPTIPDVDVCNSYYRITDKDVLKSYLHFGKVSSREIKSDEIDITVHEKFENKKDEKLYNREKNYFTMIGRDLMWKFSKYYNNSLKKWISKEKPTCIFLAPGEAKFIYDLAMKISHDYKIPIITYICDEFYFIKRPKKLLGKIQLQLLQNKISKLMKNTEEIVTICDELNKQYSEKFNVPAVTIMTGTNFQIAEEPKKLDQIDSITYLGNLAYKRDESILEIGKALDNLRENHGIECKLKLYTSNLDEKMKEAIKNSESIEYCGYVTGDAFVKAFHEAQMLLHIESFDEKCIDRVKNSISTKIADSLASGIPLLAYGPSNIASISYLKRNECAYVITQKELLEEKLKQVLLDEEKRMEIIKNGLLVAKKNHDSVINSNTIKDTLSKMYKPV